MWHQRTHSHSFILFLLLRAIATVHAAVTVYYQIPLGLESATLSPNPTAYSGPAAYNPSTLIPPPVPTPAVPNQFNVQLQNGGVPGMSINQRGSFFGFSIEMSVANQILGKNSTFIQVPFLNLMSNLALRGGSVHIRVGGNTQEQAVMVPSLPNGRILEKDLSAVTNPTQTPPLQISTDLLYLMSNISHFLPIYWYLGIPFNDTNWRLAIVEQGQAILGDNILGFQAGNEPDLYGPHGHRPLTYTPQDYMNELSSLIQTMGSDSAKIPNQNCLIGPNIASGTWTAQNMIDVNFVPQFAKNLYAVAVEHYPTDNCFAQYGVGLNRTAQEVFSSFLNHTAATNLVQPYTAFAGVAQAANKPFVMFETNTASCGGFGGISDAFGAALWALDYSMQMAYNNFTGALFHIGGQNVFYNPMTPPPTNQTSFHEWTIGPLYYSAIAMAEAFGATNKSQIIDLQANGGNVFTPAYAIYENGAPARVALFNYITDPSGKSDITVNVQIQGLSIAQAQVKYLEAASVSTKGNITWAGQTWGSYFQTDGRPQGTEQVNTITCNNNVCPVTVSAPGFALVFLSQSSLGSSEQSASTFATTAGMRGYNTATVNPGVLATSNGHRGVAVGGPLGSTSRGKSSGGARAVSVCLGVVGGAVVLGAAALLRM